MIAEICWSRLLVLAIGNTVASAAATAAVFMGGLACGSWLGGRRWRLPTASLRAYAGIEALLGVYALLSPFAFPMIQRAFAAAPADMDGSVAAVLRFGLIALFLFVPSCLMGASYPAVIAGAAAGDAPRAGGLYAANTLGAGAGCLAAGLLLLPSLGVRASLACAGLLNLLAAAAAALMPPYPPPAVPLRREPAGDGAPGEGWLSAAVFAAGLAALSYQTLMTRVAVLFFGNSIVVFPLVMAGFLFGSGLGAWWGARARFPSSGAHPLLCAVIVAGGVAAAASPCGLAALPALDLGWMGRHQDILLIAAVLLPTMLNGMILPLALRASGGGAPGRLYAWDSLGSCAGAMAAGPLAVPLLGIQGTLAAVSCGLAGLGVAAYARFVPGRGRLLALGAAAALALGACVYFPARLSGLYLAELAGGVPARMLLHREGRVATSTVLEFPDYRDFFLNGIEEASTRRTHVQLFKLLGTLPLLAHEGERPLRALMIAYGAGISAGAAAHSGRLASLDVAELNPDVEAVSALFSEVNGSPLASPAVRLFSDDGRSFLLRAKGRFDAIMVDSTHPMAGDSWVLYTREFYALAKSRLEPDGVFAIWLPTSEVPEDVFRAAVRTLLEAFPEATLWNVPGSDQTMLLAAPGPLTLDLGRLGRRLAAVPSEGRLAEYGLADPAAVAAWLVSDARGLRRFVSEGPVNTDDLPYGQRSALSAPRQSFVRLDLVEGPAPALVKGASEAERERLGRRRELARALRRYFIHLDPMALAEAVAAAPEDPDVLYQVDGEDPGRAQRAQVGAALGALQREASAPASSLSRAMACAEVLFGAGFFPEAEEIVRAGLRREPGSGVLLAAADRLRQARRQQAERMRARLLPGLAARGAKWGLLREEARARWAAGDLAGARRLLTLSLEEYPANTLARVDLADVLLRSGSEEGAREELVKALEADPRCIPALARLERLDRKAGRRREAAAAARSLAQARLRRPPWPELYPCGEYCRPWEEAVLDGNGLGSTAGRKY